MPQIALQNSVSDKLYDISYENESGKMCKLLQVMVRNLDFTLWEGSHWKFGAKE